MTDLNGSVEVSEMDGAVFVSVDNWDGAHGANAWAHISLEDALKLAREINELVAAIERGES